VGRRNPFRGQTYGTFFGLLACTGLRVSEAIELRFDDLTPDGLIIRCSRFRKSRLVPLHGTARIALDHYLQKTSRNGGLLLHLRTTSSSRCGGVHHL
jgi:integrase